MRWPQCVSAAILGSVSKAWNGGGDDKVHSRVVAPGPHAARGWMMLLGCKSAEERVATLLLLIARRRRPASCKSCTQRQPLTLDLPLSRMDMAEYLGLRVETISRQLRRLAAAGVIETSSRRSLTVRDLAALERIVERQPV